MLLADISGHRASVAPVAVALRDLMRENINFIKQIPLVATLNSQFEKSQIIDERLCSFASTDHGTLDGGSFRIVTAVVQTVAQSSG